MEGPINISNLNRGFLYGDGFFETLRIKDGSSVLWEYHLSRIQSACMAFQFKISTNFSEELEDFIQSNIGSNDCRLRINFYRSGVGKYTPIQNQVSISYTTEPLMETDEIAAYWHQIIELKNCTELETLTHKISIQNAQLITCIKPTFPLANFKLLAAPWYVLAGIESIQTPNSFPILIDQDKMVSETLTGNLLIKDASGSWFLVNHPSAIQGVHQQFLHQKLQIPFRGKIHPKTLINASEIYSINALGIQKLSLSNLDCKG